MNEHNKEQQLRNEMQRGDHAQALLDNPLTVEALDAYEQEITQAWKTSPLRDAEGREKLRLMLEASNKFKQYLLTTAQTGQMARSQVREAIKKPGPLSHLFRRAA